MNNETQNEVIIFQDDNGEINLDISLINKSKKTISEHINNIFKEGE